MTDDVIPMAECIRGHAYRITSRNLLVGVFGDSRGFVGIREKFGSEYLFVEYHYDVGAPLGTAQPWLDLGPCPIEYIGEYLPRVDEASTPYRTNQPLFDWLKAKETELTVPCTGCGLPHLLAPPWTEDREFCFRRECWDARHPNPKET